MTVVEIDADQIVESTLNPRKSFPEAAIRQLSDAMRAVGFQGHSPCLVRPLSEKFELAAGHRRTRAARMAGIPKIPCIVKVMDDHEFLEVLTFDNTNRQAVHPLHEAEGWRLWMKESGHGVVEIAARIGQSKEYVYQRLKYADLIDSIKTIFLDGKITAGQAILIARLGPLEQERTINYLRFEEYDLSVRMLDHWIKNRFRADASRSAVAAASRHIGDTPTSAPSDSGMLLSHSICPTCGHRIVD